MDAGGAAYQIVPVTEASAEAFHALDQASFFFDEPQPTADALASLDLARCYATTPTGEPPFAGIYASYDLRLTVPAPGRTLVAVPMAGLTWVGVHPDHRRRGVLTQMIRHHFEDLRGQRVPLSGLHASEPGIYGRFGYAVMALEAHLEVSRGARVTAAAFDEAAKGVRTSLVPFAWDGAAEQVQRMHVDLMAEQLGAVARNERMTRAAARDFLPARRGFEPTQALFAQRDDADVGYALLRRSLKWEDGKPQGGVKCFELVAADQAALLALARRIVDFDLTSTVTFEGRSLDDPLLWWVGGPRTATIRLYDGAWLRLVDVGAALAQRGYAAPVDVVIEVADPFCPWNEGQWRLSCAGADASATCERTEDAADLALPVQVLGSAYAGLRSIAAQAGQGLVTEASAGAVARLSAAMATATAPVAQIGF